MVDFISYGIRIVLVFVFSYFAGRVLSKKAMSQMTAYEMIGIMLIATVAAEPIVTKVTSKAIYGTGLLIGLVLLVSRLSLVNKLTPLLEHGPTVVIRNGEVDMKALKETYLSMNELYGYLRDKGYSKISDVEFGILEPQGQLSIIPKSQYRPVQPRDLNIPTKYEGLTLPIIIDGEIATQNLKHINLTEEWLVGEVKKQGIQNYHQEVAIAELDTEGNLHITKKSKV